MTAPAEAVRVHRYAHAETLGQLHVQAEKAHTRRAVLRWRADDKWQELPAWRFYRHVIRIGLFLRERLGVRAGDRVLIGSSLRVERVVAEWAAVTLGAAAVTLDVDMTDDALSSLGIELAPKVVFVGGALGRARPLEGWREAGADAVIVFDSAGPPGVARSWAEVLDLGGTLDTAERAQAFREQARALTADTTALGYVDRPGGGSVRLLTHADVVGRLRSYWSLVPPRTGDLAYVSGQSDAASWCLPLWAFVADGWTSTVLGTPGREADEVVELQPDLFVGREDSRQLRSTGPGHRREKAAGIRPLVSLTDALLHRWRPGRNGAAPRQVLRESMTFDGRRIGKQTGRLQ